MVSITACAKVLGTVELLEHTFTCLSSAELLRARAVSVTWNRVIEKSITLRRMLLREWEAKEQQVFWALNGVSNGLRKNSVRILHRNGGCVSLQPFLFNSVTFKEPTRFFRPNFMVNMYGVGRPRVQLRLLPDGNLELDKSTALFRQMFIAKPRTTTVWMHWEKDGEDGYGEEFDLRLDNEKGVTFETCSARSSQTL